MNKTLIKQVKNYEFNTKQRLLFGVTLVLALAVAYGVLVAPWLDQRRQAETIRNMAEDFPQLVAGLEKATNLNLTIESGCFTTQEKFSSGVTSCQLTAVTNEVSVKTELAAKNYFLANPGNFTTGEHFQNNTGGYTLIHNGNKTCHVVYDSPILIDCRVGYSKENKELIAELLNEQRLNEVKSNL